MTDEGSRRRRGTVTDWRDGRGFGFITCDQGGPRVFVHVSEFPDGRRPTAGRVVTFVEGLDRDGRPAARQVRYVGRGPARRSARGTGAAAVVAGAQLAWLVTAATVGPVSWWLPVSVVALSLASFATYAADKRAARAGTWRVSEATLHLLDLAGGWPGGLVARHRLRHKTAKQPFRSVFWLTVVANVGVTAALALRQAG